MNDDGVVRGPSLLRSGATGTVRHIQLCDPGRNNSLGPQMVRELRSAIETSDETRSLLISAEGRNFCAGGDHDELAKLTKVEFRQYVSELGSLFTELPERLPSVACVHRAAVGGGVELALRSDYILAADDAWFQFPQLSLGGRIGPHTLQLLVCRVGLSTARRLCLFGQRINAQDACAVGLVDDVVARAEMITTGMELARKLGALPERGLSQFRSTVNSMTIS